MQLKAHRQVMCMQILSDSELILQVLWLAIQEVQQSILRKVITDQWVLEPLGGTLSKITRWYTLISLLILPPHNLEIAWSGCKLLYLALKKWETMVFMEALAIVKSVWPLVADELGQWLENSVAHSKIREQAHNQWIMRTAQEIMLPLAIQIQHLWQTSNLSSTWVFTEHQTMRIATTWADHRRSTILTCTTRQPPPHSLQICSG